MLRSPLVSAWLFSKTHIGFLIEHTWDISETEADSVKATLRKSGDDLLLTIEGTGRMVSFDREQPGSGTAWHTYINMTVGWLIAIGEVRADEGVTNIGACAFSDCSHLKTVILPATLTEIGAGAFRGCEDLETIHYNGTRTQWAQIDLGEGWSTGIHGLQVECSDGVLEL